MDAERLDYLERFASAARISLQGAAIRELIVEVRRLQADLDAATAAIVDLRMESSAYARGVADGRAPAAKAVALIARYGGIDGGHHKQWLLDQVIHTLMTEAEYREFVDARTQGEDGEPDVYSPWDEGIAP